MAQTTAGSKPVVSMIVTYEPLQGCFAAPELRISKSHLEQILGDALSRKGVAVATSGEPTQRSVYLTVYSCKSVGNGQVDAHAISFGIGLYKEKVPGGRVVANDKSGLVSFGGSAANNQAAKARSTLEQEIRNWVDSTRMQ